MAHLSASTRIDAPVNVVFAYTDDHTHTTSYMEGLSRWEPAGSRTHGKGATFAVAMKAGPLTLDGVIEITEWVENRSIAWRSTSGIRQAGRWSFRADGKGTEVTLDVEVELPGGIAGRMATRLAEPVLRGNAQRSVEKLRQQTERLARVSPRSARPRGGGGRAGARGAR